MLDLNLGAFQSLDFDLKLLNLKLYFQEAD
jgi:hypothetical protein